MFKSGRRGSAAWDGAYVRNVRAQLEDGSMGLQGIRMPPGFAVLLRAQSPIAFLRSKMMTTHLNIPVSSMPLLQKQIIKGMDWPVTGASRIPRSWPLYCAISIGTSTRSGAPGPPIHVGALLFRVAPCG